MLNAYNPPIAVALGCVASTLSPDEAARLSAQSSSPGQTRGLSLVDITSASARATAANGLRARRQPRALICG
ncbi:MAG TPA: hypothetical protein VL051_00780 [Burkholderiaceae bacterium]|nr:hypothetical protein [Burkholderiaceae bacterium]